LDDASVTAVADDDIGGYWRQRFCGSTFDRSPHAANAASLNSSRVGDGGGTGATTTTAMPAPVMAITLMTAVAMLGY